MGEAGRVQQGIISRKRIKGDESVLPAFMELQLTQACEKERKGKETLYH